jgi:hypothetical protein
VLPKSKVDLYAAIRRDSRQGLSNRAVQRKYAVGSLTVQKALSSARPEPRKKLPPWATRLDPFKPLIDEMLPNSRHQASRSASQATARSGTRTSSQS